MNPSTRTDHRPLLIYDGDCAFCGYWAHYWERLTQGRVRFEAYQDVASGFPEISVEAFKAAVQFVTPQRSIARAAEASLLTLSHAPGKGYLLALYRRVPGFAALAEWVYRFIAAHRPTFYRASLLLWGRVHLPPRYDSVSWLFLRCLGLVYLAAFVSFGSQVLGLVGSQGILPLADYLAAAHQHLGAAAYFRLPTVFWLNASDLALQVACWLGAAFAVLLCLDRLPRVSLVLLYLLYLSLVYAGQEFMTFQWDLLLLEAGFLAIWLPTGSRLVVWLFRWLVFRFMFLSGVVKLASGDPTWASLTALRYHFETQPLPTPLAWYAHQLPDQVLRLGVGATFAIELLLPLFIVLPRNLRLVAAVGIVLLQVGILLTGNYNFFNILTIVLCLFLFDDAAIARALPARWLGPSDRSARITPPSMPARCAVLVLTVAALTVGGTQVAMAVSRSGAPRWAAGLMEAIAPLCIVNPYGVFAVMSTQRAEIVVEGSEDGLAWREYGYRYKPGDPMRRPAWNIPHQPRLDWQMWFAALGSEAQNPWFARLLRQLLRNSPPVLALLEDNPFPDKPPKQVRALIYDYRFSTSEGKRIGQWWTRELSGMYYPAVSAHE